MGKLFLNRWVWAVLLLMVVVAGGGYLLMGPDQGGKRGVGVETTLPRADKPRRQVVGEITQSKGLAYSQFGQTKRTLSEGDPVFQEDRIVTGRNARLILKMKDDAVIALGEDSEFVVAQYQFQAEAESGNGILELTRGLIRFTTGKLGKLKQHPFKISTPVATLGVRGTEGFLRLSGTGADQASGNDNIEVITLEKEILVWMDESRRESGVPGTVGFLDRIPLVSPAAAAADTSKPPQSVTKNQKLTGNAKVGVTSVVKATPSDLAKAHKSTLVKKLPEKAKEALVRQAAQAMATKLGIPVQEAAEKLQKSPEALESIVEKAEQQLVESTAEAIEKQAEVEQQREAVEEKIQALAEKESSGAELTDEEKSRKKALEQEKAILDEQPAQSLTAIAESAVDETLVSRSLESVQEEVGRFTEELAQAVKTGKPLEQALQEKAEAVVKAKESEAVAMGVDLAAARQAAKEAVQEARAPAAGVGSEAGAVGVPEGGRGPEGNAPVAPGASADSASGITGVTGNQGAGVGEGNAGGTPPGGGTGEAQGEPGAAGGTGEVKSEPDAAAVGDAGAVATEPEAGQTGTGTTPATEPAATTGTGTEDSLYGSTTGAAESTSGTTPGTSSSSTDDNNTPFVPTPSNRVPEMSDQTIVLDENSAVGTVVGKVVATDKDKDTLAFSLVESSTVFAVDGKGVLTVLDSAALDFEARTSFTLNVAVTDGKADAKKETKSVTAVVTVLLNNVNEAPTVTSPASVSVDEDTLLSFSGSSQISVADVDAVTGAFKVTLGVTRGTLTLQSTSGVVFSSGSNGTGSFTVTGQPADLNTALASLTYQAAANYSGPDLLGVAVSDEGSSGKGSALGVSRNVAITVRNLNDPPLVSEVSDLTIAEDGTTGVLNFSVGDQETSADLLLVTASSSDAALVPQANLLLGGSGPNRTLTVVPAANMSGTATITLTVADPADATSTAKDTFVLTVSPVPDAPRITSTTTREDTQSSSGLVVTPSAVDGAEVTHFRINGITTGTLYKSDGVTRLVNGDFITLTEGAAGLRFTPTADKNTAAGDSFSFTAAGAASASTSNVSAEVTTASITVTAVNDAPGFTLLTTDSVGEDSGTRTVSAFATGISRGPADESGQSLSFTLTPTATSTLSFTNPPAIDSSGTLTYTPAADAYGSATVSVVLADNGGTSNGGVDISETKSFTITVTAKADAPVVTGASTREDTQSTSGLVVGRNGRDGSEVTHFKVTGVTNGTLYKSDGTTAIAVNSFITYAEGNAGLRFTPDANLNSEAGDSFSVTLAGATAAVDAAVSPTSTSATITVAAVNDAPTFTLSSGDTVAEDSGARSVANFATGKSPGHGNESAQTTFFTVTTDSADSTLTFTVAPAIDGNGTLTYTPAADAFGTAVMKVVLTDNGGTASGGADTSASRNFTLTVSGKADTPSVTAASTNEDTLSGSGLVISRNAVDGSEVTHFQITGITNGTLFKNDGVTQLTDSTFITYAEGASGLRFLPSINLNSTTTSAFGFTIQASTSSNSSGLGGSTRTAAVTVVAVNDPPTVTAIAAQTTEEDTAKSGVTFTVADVESPVAELTVTAVSSNTTLVPDANLVLSGTAATRSLSATPATNQFGSTTLSVIVAESADPASTATSSFVLTVNPVADQPSVSAATTSEDTQTTTGLVLTRNSADGNEVTQFKISGITNGTLYKNDGVTQISSNDLISFAEGNAGLKFTPAADLNSDGGNNFGFTVAGVTSAAAVGSSTVTAAITVNSVADTPTVTATTTNEDTKSTSGLVISRNLVDGAEVTHFKISGITGGTLYKNDGTTAIGDNEFITYTEGTSGLKFLPSANLNSGKGDSFGFGIQASLSAGAAGLGGGVARASITVTAVADTPSVTSASTNEDTQSTSGLVISRNVDDSAEVTHFKITGILGGRLYKNNGTTQITDGTFVTFAEGNAGLKFTPSANLNTADGTTFRFTVQASTSNAGSGLGGSTVNATIAVTAVADAPSDITLNATEAYACSVNGTVVGALTTVDPDVGNTHTYTLTDSAGGLFALSGSNLTVIGALTAGTTKSVTVVSTGIQDSLPLSKTITLTIVNPTLTTTLNATSFYTGSPTGTVVAGITSVNPSAANATFTYVLTTDGTGGLAIGGTGNQQLVVADASRFTTTGNYSITITATDSTCGITTATNFTLAVTGKSCSADSVTTVTESSGTIASTAKGIYTAAMASLSSGTPVTLTEANLYYLLLAKLDRQLTSGGTFAYDVTGVVKKLRVSVAPSQITVTGRVGVIGSIYDRLPATVQSGWQTLFDTLAPYAANFTTDVCVNLVPVLSGNQVSVDTANSTVDILYLNILPDVTMSLNSLISNYNSVLSGLSSGGSLTFFTGGGANPPLHVLESSLGDPSLARAREAQQNTLNRAGDGDLAFDSTASQSIPTTQFVDYYFPGLVSSVTIGSGSITLTP
ncbi:MAG: FecR domain-containing protein [Magnetococcales bacterium]|nr:FecR domain-containing protein [Magnetococcales bacterium]